MVDAGRYRSKAFGVLGLATHAHGKQGATVEGILAGDDFVLFRTEMIGGIFACQLEAGFIGLGTGVAEEGTIGKGGGSQRMSQFQYRLVGEHIGHMPQLASLFGQRSHQLRVAMAQRIHGDTASQINEFTTILIPDSRSQALDRNEGSRAVVGDHDLVEISAGDRIAHLYSSLPAWSSVPACCPGQ